MMSLSFLLLMLATVQTASSAPGDDDDAPGFQHWWTTNKDTYEDYPIKFEKPLPNWIYGTLVRNGPGQFEMGNRKFTQALDGYAKLMSWKFPGDGSCLFTTKFIQSSFYKTSVEINDIAPYLNFGVTVPPYDDEQKVAAMFNAMDNMNVNFYNYSNTFVAVTDLWKSYQIDLPTLDTVRLIDPKIPTGNHPKTDDVVSLLSSAHPIPEYGNPGAYIDYLAGTGMIPGVIKDKITVIRTKGAEDHEVIAEWRLDSVPYMHSFAVTENHVVFIAHPYYQNFMTMAKNGYAAAGVEWNNDEKAKVFVVNIPTGKMETFETETVFALHHANAYEVNNILTVDIPVQPDPYFFKKFDFQSILNATERMNMSLVSKLRRYTIDMNTKNITHYDFPDALNMEIPTFNENYRSKPYCYVYGVVFNWNGKGFSHTGIVKKDVCGKTETKMFQIPHHYPTEAFFVPAPPEVAKEEDDGVLLMVILDGDRGLSYIGVVDPKTMTLINKAYLPTTIPFNYHGRFFPGVW
ncbi:beta,beta-carotene 15,15'-dioxygenase-like [Argopecten irradians]|uniref:beta,beta-carotene 15,15'-dioxygenase-like n=1 Tax=Argopecten irradians TaxID=31199 RepID=UPI00371A3445